MKRPKKSFPTTDETREALNGNEVSVAKKYGCEPPYIFNIKNGHEPDPFAPFLDWFQEVAFGGGKVRPYMHTLERIAHQAENGVNPTVNLTEKFLSKIASDFESTQVLAKSIADNYLDGLECSRILEACDRMKAEEQSLRKMALNRLNELKAAKEAKRKG